MKNKHIWLFYISFLVIHFSSKAHNKNELVYNDTIVNISDSLKKKNYALRFGFDLLKIALSQTDKNYSGFEVVGDLNFFENLFLSIECGTEDKTKQSEKINFTTTGSYIKLGADYNMYKNWKGMNNHIYIGIRFANSIHKQRVNSFYLRNSDFLWGNELITSGTGIGLRENLNASWIEFVTGIKVSVCAFFKSSYFNLLNISELYSSILSLVKLAPTELFISIIPLCFTNIPLSFFPQVVI